MSLFKKTVKCIFVAVVLCLTVVVMGLSLSAKVSDSRTFSFGMNVDADVLVTYLEQNAKDCPKRIDISRFGIPFTDENLNSLQELVWHGTPILFHVDGVGFSGSGGMVQYIYFTYHYDADTYQRMYDQCVRAAERMTADLKNNKAVTDVTKALILHDRIIANCEYDLLGVSTGNVKNESREMYGALVSGRATCQGYAYAYMYLLDEVGIESYICSSKAMNHDWNIVIINGKKYHVDVTFDDPVEDITGRVYHKHFMLSTQALKKADHNYGDFDASPTDTAFDNYYWRNSESEFVMVNGDIYYINHTNETLNKLGNPTPLAKLSDVWSTSGGNSYWLGNYCRLSTDGITLFYSKSNAIYSYNVSNGSSKVIYTPTLSGEAKSIYGFKYDKGYLVIDRFNSPIFTSYTKQKYQIRVPYDVEAPTVSMSYTSNIAAYQTVNFGFSDNNGVAGYYWGTNPTVTKNSYTPVSNGKATEYVSKSGTYYLAATDNAGNISNPTSVTFYATRLETDGGRISVSTVISPKGATFILPTPERDGYEFVGWSKKYTDNGEYFKEYTPAADSVLYAIWKYTGQQGSTFDPSDYVNRFVDVSDNAWYADAVAYCAQRGYINGISATVFSPAGNLTREQFVLILANFAGVDSDNYKYTNSSMKDVPVGRWYSGAVSWAVSEGYVKGVAPDLFGLHQFITREQLTRLIYVYAADTSVNVEGRTDLTVYKDVSNVSDWAYESMSWAVEQGIVTGMTSDTLLPKGNVTRAQTARIFMLFDKLNKK